MLEEFYLLEQQVAQLTEALALGWTAAEHEGVVVVQRVASGIGTEAELLLVEVEVDEATAAIVEHILHGLCQKGIAATIALLDAESNGKAFGVLAVDETDDGAGDGLFLYLVEFGHSAGNPTAKVFVDNLDGLVGIEVTGHRNAHVVRHIVGVVEAVDVGHRGILEVLDGAEGGLGAVGVMWEESAHHLLVDAAVVLCQADVLLLVDGLELGVEETEDKVGETVGLHLGPGLQHVGRDVLHVHGVVVASEGVGTIAADGGHRLVVLVGDGDG